MRTVVPEQSWDADQAVTELYAVHYQSLVRTAALLVRNSGEAEEIVQDAFVTMHQKWRRLRDPQAALGYLRRTVINRARSSQRHNKVVDRYAPRLVEHDQLSDTAEQTVTRQVVMQALDSLPDRQREVLVLRYYSDLSEQDIAAALGISRGAVKSHASRGMSALRGRLKGDA